MDMWQILNGIKKGLRVYWILNVSIFLIINIIGFVYLKTSKTYYKSTLTMLPPQQQSSTMALLSSLGGVGALAGGASSVKSPSDVYVTMLKSRNLTAKVATQCEPLKTRPFPNVNAATQWLMSVVTVELNKDGLLYVSVVDTNSMDAKTIANCYTPALKIVMNDFSLSSAKSKRIFIEKQFEKAKVELKSNEDKLSEYQKKKGVVEFNTQSQASVEAKNALDQKIKEKETELSIATLQFSDENVRTKQIKRELLELKKGMSSGGGFVLNRSQILSGGVEYLRIMRNLKQSEEVYEMLLKQYEMAKIEEANDVTNVQVMDYAMDGVKVKPNSKVVIILFVLLSLFVVVFVSLIPMIRKFIK